MYYILKNRDSERVIQAVSGRVISFESRLEVENFQQSFLNTVVGYCHLCTKKEKDSDIPVVCPDCMSKNIERPSNGRCE